MAAAWPGSCLAQEGMHSCFVSIAPELFCVVSRQINLWNYHLGLSFEEIISLHPFMLNKLHESCSCEKLGSVAVLFG